MLLLLGNTRLFLQFVFIFTEVEDFANRRARRRLNLDQVKAATHRQLKSISGLHHTYLLAIMVNYPNFGDANHRVYSDFWLSLAYFLTSDANYYFLLP